MTSAELQEKMTVALIKVTEKYGSTLFSLTWKAHLTPARRLIFRLRGSARLTSGNGCTSLESWSTPSAHGSAGEISEDLAVCGRKFMNTKTGRVLQSNLATEAKMLASWPTPNTMDTIDREGLRPSRIATNRESGYLTEIVNLASWPTPTAPAPHDSEKTAGRARSREGYGADLAIMASWATPNCRDWKSDFDPEKWIREGQGQPLSRQALVTASGDPPSGSPAETEKRGQLNPAFSRWLMGLPPVWDDCGAMVMRSVPRSRKSS